MKNPAFVSQPSPTLARRELDVIVYKDRETNWFWAQIVQLPGSFVTAPSMDELLHSLQGAVLGFLQTAKGMDDALWSDRVEDVLHYQLAEDNSLIPIP